MGGSAVAAAVARQEDQPHVAQLAGQELVRGAPNGLSTRVQRAFARPSTLVEPGAADHAQRPASHTILPAGAGLIAERRRLGYRSRLCASPCVLALAAVVASAGAARAGETRCWMDRGVLVVPAAFGDVAGDFILDLSAPGACCMSTGAQCDGIETPQSHGHAAPGQRDHPGAPAGRRPRRAHPGACPPTIIGAHRRGRAGRLRRRPPLRPLPRARCGGAGAAVRMRRDACRSRRPTACRRSWRRSRTGVAALAGRFAIDTGTAGVRLSAHVAALSRTPAQGVDPALARLDPPARLDALGLAGEARRRLPAALEDDLPAGALGGIGTAAWSRYDVRHRPRPRPAAARAPGRGVSARRSARSPVAGVEQPGEDQQVDHHRAGPVCLRSSIFGSDAQVRKADDVLGLLVERRRACRRRR